MRSCDGLVDSLLYVIHTCVNTSDYDSKVRGPSLAVTVSARLRVPPHLLGVVWIHRIRLWRAQLGRSLPAPVYRCTVRFCCVTPCLLLGAAHFHQREVVCV